MFLPIQRRVVGLAFAFALLAPATSMAQAVPPTLSVQLGDGAQLAMVLVSGGSFRQGSPGSEAGRGDDETLRDVTITSPFYIGRYPVTRGQFALFVDQSGYVTEAEKGTSGGSGWDGHQLVQRKDFTWRSPGFTQSDNDPVTLVTFADAEAFAAWATTKAGRPVRLPTEAQWEYAARAGSRTAYFNATDEQHALTLGWFQQNAGSGTRPVGRRAPNAWNLHEMSGNVFEWCRDWYAPYAPGPVTDPEVTTPPAGAGDAEAPRRVLRGGSWLKPARAGRSAARYRNTPGSRNADNGFRLIADPHPPGGAGAAPRIAPLLPPSSSPTPETTGDTRSSSGVGIAIAALVGVFGALVAFIAVFLRRGRSRGTFDPGSVQTRVGSDGFWILAPAGARVRYEAMVGGVPVSDAVTLDPGPEGTFIYTGSSPTQVRILQVTSMAAATPFLASQALADEPVSIPQPPPRGEPPAY